MSQDPPPHHSSDEDEERDEDMARVAPESRAPAPESRAPAPESRSPAPGLGPEPGGKAAAPPEEASEAPRGSSLFSWLQSRTIRRGVFVDPARDNFRTMTSLYRSMNPAAEAVNLSSKTHGAVFNLEYSPDGLERTRTPREPEP